MKSRRYRSSVGFGFRWCRIEDFSHLSIEVHGKIPTNGILCKLPSNVDQTDPEVARKVVPVGDNIGVAPPQPLVFTAEALIFSLQIDQSLGRIRRPCERGLLGTIELAEIPMVDAGGTGSEKDRVIGIIRIFFSSCRLKVDKGSCGLQEGVVAHAWPRTKSEIGSWEHILVKSVLWSVANAS
jgi:hypothetical protein